MREIKFRGIDAVTKKYVYGYYCPILCDETMPHLYIKAGASAGFCKVEPDSVAQFVGFDKNGADVYEGDKLINDTDGTRFKAAMNHIHTIKHYRKAE